MRSCELIEFVSQISQCGTRLCYNNFFHICSPYTHTHAHTHAHIHTHAHTHAHTNTHTNTIHQKMRLIPTVHVVSHSAPTPLPPRAYPDKTSILVYNLYYRRDWHSLIYTLSQMKALKPLRVTWASSTGTCTNRIRRRKG